MAGTPFWPYPFWIAHRGGGLHAPENTLAAFAEGRRYGFTMAECDVKLSRDSVPVLLHDDDLKRTGGHRERAVSLSAAELAQKDVSQNMPSFAGEGVPELAQIAEFCLKNHMLVNLEIKPSLGQDEECGREIGLQAALLWQNAPVKPLFSSFYIKSLEALAQVWPDSTRALLIEEWLDEDMLIAELTRLGCVSLNAPDTGTTAARIERLHAAGFKVLVWTVNDMARAQELIAWGVDGIITDELAQVAAQFAL